MSDLTACSIIKFDLQDSEAVEVSVRDVVDAIQSIRSQHSVNEHSQPSQSSTYVHGGWIVAKRQRSVLVEEYLIP